MVSENQIPQIQIRQGECFSIRLEFIPGTGYRWEVFQYDESKVSLLSSTTLESQSGARLGAPEIQEISFVSHAVGEAQIELIYRRPWEPLGDFLKRIVVIVTIM